MPRPSPALPALLAISGFAALVCEVVWMRRLSLALGSTGLAVALTLGLYMLGLGLGSALAGRVRWRGAPRGYGALELGVSAWTLLFPAQIAGLIGHGEASAARDALLAALLLVPPALLHGATLPAASAALEDARRITMLYAMNTAGAVLGALAAPLLLLPVLGVSGSERAAALAAGAVGIAAWTLGGSQAEEPDAPSPEPSPPRWNVLLAAALGGGAAMALEVAWTRLGALLLGGSVYALGAVLAVFLAGIALGAGLGRRLGVGPALGAMGVAAMLGVQLYRWLPTGLGLAYGALGDGAVLPVGTLLLGLAMGGVPLASGALFTAALEAEGGAPTQRASRVLLANTMGGVIGAISAGLVGLPTLGLQGTVGLVAALCSLGAALIAKPVSRRYTYGTRLTPLVLVGLLTALAPPWDARAFAAGLVHRLDQFADPSPRAVDRYAHQGWDLLLYQDGVTATVAVGEGHRGTRWLSANGKVDASTGEDMPTQQTSGALPVTVARAARPEGALEALVVGLASGITAGEALSAGASAVTVVEIEPAVLRAADLFSRWNHDLLRDPRATIVVADARAWLRRQDRRWPVLISEPSNPWITGVSNLFTQEYWSLARDHLETDGVFCQWVQLYALPPEALRSLIRTFLSVFPRAWLFETIQGADALLVAAPALPPDLPWQPRLGPEGLALLAGRAPLNTDELPWVEFEAPRWLLRSTGARNAALIEEAAGRTSTESTIKADN